MEYCSRQDGGPIFCEKKSIQTNIIILSSVATFLFSSARPYLTAREK